MEIWARVALGNPLRVSRDPWGATPARLSDATVPAHFHGDGSNGSRSLPTGPLAAPTSLASAIPGAQLLPALWFLLLRISAATAAWTRCTPSTSGSRGNARLGATLTRRPGTPRRGSVSELFEIESAIASVTPKAMQRVATDLKLADQFEGEAFRLGLREPPNRMLSCSTLAVGTTPATCGLPMPFAMMEFEGGVPRLGAAKG